MILCEEPYLNEPGWADKAGSAESRTCEIPSHDAHDLCLDFADSKNVRRMVVKAAVSMNGYVRVSSSNSCENLDAREFENSAR